MSVTDSFIVSYSSESEDHAVLIVGKQSKRGVMNIINAFQGEEAKDLYKRLLEKKN